MKAIENGYFQKEIHKSAYAFQRAVERDEKNVIGVNMFSEGKRINKYGTLKVAPRVVKKQVSRTRSIRRKRDQAAVRTALENLRRNAVAEQNLMASILDCVKKYATIGEMSDVLRDVYGEFKEKNLF